MLEPLNERILLKKIEHRAENNSGLHLPENVSAGLNYFEVLAMGRGQMLPNGTLVEPQVAVGDKVVMLRNPTEVRYGLDRYFVTTEREIAFRLPE